MALAWALPDETSKQADRFLVSTPEKSIFWVPGSWWYEIANALTMAQRRKRLTESDRMRLMELYGMFPIKTDTLLSKDAIWRVQALALEFTLSAYDAVYLELAERRGLGLATLDRPLHTAARNAGIKVIHL